MNRMISVFCACLLILNLFAVLAVPVSASDDIQALEELVNPDAPRSYCEIPLYLQTDYPDIRYGTGTIATSGCSVTCLAMVSSYLTGIEYTPDELANHFMSFDESNHIKKLEYMSTEMNLPWQKAENFHVALNALKEGKIVIALMGSKSLFTNGQHFILLGGYNDEGKIWVNDPNAANYGLWNLKNAFQEGFEENDILLGYTGGWIYDPAGVAEAPVEELKARSKESYSYQNVPLYFQTDYSGIRYGAGTIATSGCSVTSLAMVATYLTGHNYMPDELADYFSDYNSENHVEKLEYMSDQLQLPWEKAENFHVALDALRKGKVVIALMEETSAFTDGQHFIVLTGLNENGRIMVNDPNAVNYTLWNLKPGFSDGFQDHEIWTGYGGAWVYDPEAMPEEPFIYVDEKEIVECRYPGISLTMEEEDILAQMVWVEARGESFEGQQAIAEIVLNRLVSEKFQDSVKGVIYAENQFRSTEFLEDAEPSSIQYEAVERALEGPYVLPMDVVHFATYPVNKNVWGQIGGHIFCYES